MNPDKARQLARQVANPLPLVGFLTRRLALDELLRTASTGNQEAIHALVGLFLEGRIEPELLRFAHPAAQAGVCREWVASRDPRLEHLIVTGGFTADGPPAVRVLALLLRDRGGDIALGGDAWAPALLMACQDSALGPRALAALEALPDPEARDAVCRAVLTTNYPPEAAVERLVRLGWAPEEEGLRALFLFVTGQLERFDDLDYDHSLLKASYADLPEGLRARVVARIRDSGRADLVRVLQADEPRRRLHGLTPEEYEAVVQVLHGSRRLNDLWAMVFTAAPEWSAEILGLLEREGYEPRQQDREAYSRLLALRPSRGRNLRLQLPDITLNASQRAFDTPVRGLAFSPNGKLVAVGGKSPAVRLWDPYSGSDEGELRGHAGVVTALAFSPDSRILATGGSDHGAYLWDPWRRRQLRQIFPDEAPVGTLTMTFSKNGRFLGVGGWETGVLVDLEENRELLLQGHTECVVGVAFDPGERWVATASWDGTARIWTLPSLRQSRILHGHTDKVVALAFTDDGEHLITVGRDGRVLRRASAGFFSAGAEMIGYHGQDSGKRTELWKMALHPQGRLVATSGDDGAIRLWGDGKATLTSKDSPGSGRTTDLAFSPDGFFLGRTSRSSEFTVWQLGEEARRVPVVSSVRDGGLPECLAFSPDSRTLAVGFDSGLVGFWSLFQTKPVGRMDQEDLARVESWMKSAHPEQRAVWEFVAELIRLRFRHDIGLGEATGAMLDEFAIDLE